MSEALLFDFSDPHAAAQWQSIDDRIMGGISQSHPEFVPEVGLNFHGNVSLENNGGFASIRSASAHYDLGDSQGIRLRVKGDGQTYKLSLRTDRYYDGVSYQASFTTTDDWQEIDLPFDSFIPTHHGVRLNTVAALDSTTIQSFGLFIADRQEGPFRLDIAWIKGI